MTRCKQRLVLKNYSPNLFFVKGYLRKLILSFAITSLSLSGAVADEKSKLSRLTQSQLKKLQELTITEKGLGPVEIGMHVDEASRLLGIDIRQTKSQYGGVSCYSYALGVKKFDWTVRFITQDEKIGKIDIYDSAISMRNGLAVGKPMKEAQSIYSEKYKILPAYEWPEKAIAVEGDDGIWLEFTGPLLFKKDTINPPYPVEGINEVIKKVSIGLENIGTVEGCL